MVWLSDQQLEGSYAIPHDRRPMHGRTAAAFALLLVTFTVFGLSFIVRLRSVDVQAGFSVRSPTRAAPPLPAATVIVTDVQRGTARTVTTDESGTMPSPIFSPEPTRFTSKPKASRPSSDRTCRSKWPAMFVPISPFSPDK